MLEAFRTKNAKSGAADPIVSLNAPKNRLFSIQDLCIGMRNYTVLYVNNHNKITTLTAATQFCLFSLYG